MTRTLVLLACSASLFLSACAESDDGIDPDVLDVRVPLPASDSRYLDLVTPEFRIEPGVEKMYCVYLSNEEGEIAVRTMEAYQGEFGHHIVLLTTIVPQPAGTVEDCTSQEEMWKFRSFILPGSELPPGHGIRVGAGMQFVMQIHYVNAGERPILVRDVARLDKIDPSQVTTWVTTLTTNSLRIALSPGQAVEQFECTLAEDVDLLLLGGHMHELGARFSVDIGASAAALDNVYLVEPWRPQYRDAPPVTLFFSEPRHLAAGTVVRTTCAWNNTTTGVVDFPAEMCAAFGYLAGTTTPVHCEPAE